jgi:outer membrane immunogenic protein
MRSLTLTRTLLSVAAALAALSLPTQAADLGGWTPRSPAPEPYDASPLDTARWTGAYLGIAGGYTFGDIDVSNGGINVQSFDQSGGTGWLYGGYNWQFGRIVAGLEADIGTGSISGSEGSGPGLVGADLNYEGSLRGRAGFLLAPQFLVYGTAGFAWSDMDISLANTSASEIFSGYTIGAGTELNFAGPWTLRLEYLYTDLDAETITRGGTSSTIDPDSHTLRAGVSFKF